MNALFKKNLIDFVIAIAVFIAINIIFFLPVFQGKMLVQSDIINFQGASKEAIDYYNKTGDVALWTNSMFGGMPTFQVWLPQNGNLFEKINLFIGLNLPRPANYTFIAFLFFYLLLRSFKVNNWLSIAGGVCYGLGTYLITFIVAGHNSKVNAVAIMPLVFAGVNYIFQNRKWLGISLALLGMCLEITANHVQITYYMFFILACWMIAELFNAIKNKTLLVYFKNIAIIALISAAGVLANSSRLLTTYIYSKETIRAGSELSKAELEKNKTTQITNEGLDKTYVFDWSYGIGETFTLMYPNFAGQASGQSFLQKDNSNTTKYFQQLYSKNKSKAQQLQQLSSKYWGQLPFTSGPVYVGSIICFLFLAGAILAKPKLKWWLIAATVLSVFLAWGKYFPQFNDLMYNYFPLYNKFRTVMMALVIACLTMPLLAFIIFDKYISNTNEYPEQQKLKALKWSGITVLLITLIMLVPSTLFNLQTPEEKSIAMQYATDNDITGLMDALKSDRTAMIRTDAMRTVFFVGITAALLFFYLKKKIDKRIVIFAIGLLAITDLWTIDKIYLTKDNYGDKDYYAKYLSSQVPKINDPDPDYRVFNAMRRLDQDGITPYTYKNIGGYSAVKLRRYQDVIDGYLSKGNINVASMLNAKYFITANKSNNKPVVQTNPMAYGHAWIVDSINFSKTPDEEFDALGKINLKTQAVVDEQFKNQIKSAITPHDSAATIQLNKYSPNEISYTYSGTTDAPVVFSEIFYRGNTDWKAYIDGKYTEHFRADYILRGIWAPAGKHEITFKFEPQSFYTGKKISAASSGLLILLIIGMLFVDIRKMMKNEINSDMQK